MYDLEIKPEADKIFSKLSKKNSQQLKSISNKITQIRKNPFGHKYLRKPLNGFNRVHIDTSFVLIFKIDHERKIITIYYFDHHDYVYQWKPE